MNKPHPAPARKVEHGTFTRCPVCLQAVVLRDQQTNHDVVVNLRQYNALQKVLETKAVQAIARKVEQEGEA